MSVAEWTVVQSCVIIFALDMVFVRRDLHVDSRKSCQRLFVIFSLLLVYTQFQHLPESPAPAEVKSAQASTVASTEVPPGYNQRTYIVNIPAHALIGD